MITWNRNTQTVEVTNDYREGNKIEIINHRGQSIIYSMRDTLFRGYQIRNVLVNGNVWTEFMRSRAWQLMSPCLIGGVALIGSPLLKSRNGNIMFFELAEKIKL